MDILTHMGYVVEVTRGESGQRYIEAASIQFCTNFTPDALKTPNGDPVRCAL